MSSTLFERIWFTEQKNKDDYIKKYTTITTAYGKKNLHRPVPSLNEVDETEFFDKDEYKKASRLNQGDVYLIQVKETIEIQNRKAVLSDDFLSGIQRDEPLTLPCVDMYKFILSKSKEQRINFISSRISEIRLVYLKNMNQNTENRYYNT